MGNPSRLTLSLRLLDAHRNRKIFPAAAESCAAHRGCAEIVQTVSHSNVSIGHANAIGRIKANPAKILNISFRPCVTGVLCGDTIGAVKCPPI